MIHYQDRWAIVTGASSGLGRRLAARLADRGMSLVLTGRNETRLNETRTGFVDALGADVAHTAIYRSLADPEPVIETALRAFDRGRAVAIPGLRNQLLASSGRFMPREWLTRVTARLLGGTTSRPPIEVRNEVLVDAPAERVWNLLADVESWPSWFRACRWVRALGSANGARRPAEFRWKAHPITLRSSVIDAQRPSSFAISARTPGLIAEHRFTLAPGPDGSSTLVVSHEIQRGLLPWLGRAYLAPRLRASNQRWLLDLAEASRHRSPPAYSRVS